MRCAPEVQCAAPRDKCSSPTPAASKHIQTTRTVQHWHQPVEQCFANAITCRAQAFAIHKPILRLRHCPPMIRTRLSFFAIDLQKHSLHNESDRITTLQNWIIDSDHIKTSWQFSVSAKTRKTSEQPVTPTTNRWTANDCNPIPHHPQKQPDTAPASKHGKFVQPHQTWFSAPAAASAKASARFCSANVKLMMI